MTSKPYIVPMQELFERMTKTANGMIASANFTDDNTYYTVLFASRKELKEHLRHQSTFEVAQAAKALGRIVGPIFLTLITLEEIDTRLANTEIEEPEFDEHYMNPIWHYVKAVAKGIEGEPKGH